ncbi:MAG TPA: hypothetical protein VF789_04135 [Thermoanaerobaculia bacterium]
MPEESSWDLSRFTETIRRRLYDRIAADLGVLSVSYTADQAGLQIWFFAGRWFAVWADLEEPPEQPAALRTRLVRIGVGANGEIELFDV